MPKDFFLIRYAGSKRWVAHKRGVRLSSTGAFDTFLLFFMVRSKKRFFFLGIEIRLLFFSSSSSNSNSRAFHDLSCVCVCVCLETAHTAVAPNGR